MHPGARSTPRVNDATGPSSLGIGAALLLLAFVASEILAVIGVLRH
jgi:hypothetical protein